MDNTNTNNSNIVTQLVDALYAGWNSKDGATITLRRGRHMRTARLYPNHKHDLWLFKATNAKGNRELVGRIDLRDGIPPHLVAGWVIV